MGERVRPAGSRFISKSLVRSAIATRRARETAVLRGRTTADRTDAAAGRGCKKPHALVHEGIPGRVINRSRRGSTRNTVKTLEDRIEAPRLFARSTAADVPRVGPELAIHKLILPATSDQRGRPRGADSSAFAQRQKERLESRTLHVVDASLRWHKKSSTTTRRCPI